MPSMHSPRIAPMLRKTGHGFRSIMLGSGFQCEVCEPVVLFVGDTMHLNTRILSRLNHVGGTATTREGHNQVRPQFQHTAVPDRPGTLTEGLPVSRAQYPLHAMLLRPGPR